MNDIPSHTEDYGNLADIAERFALRPADAEALERRDARRRAAEQMDASNQPTKADLPQFSIAGSRPNVAAVLAVEQALNGPTSIDDTLAARNAVHGDFTDDAGTAQAFKDVMRATKNWDALDHVKREALEHIATKIGRILSGDPNHKDHWFDCVGYCTLVIERL